MSSGPFKYYVIRPAQPPRTTPPKMAKKGYYYSRNIQALGILNRPDGRVVNASG